MKLCRYLSFSQRLCIVFQLLAVPLTLLVMHEPVHAKACEKPSQLRLSIVPQGGLHQDITGLKPLITALEYELKTPVNVIQANSYGGVVEGLLSGTVDLARLGPASYVAAKRADPRITAFASYARKADIFHQERAAYYSLLIAKSSSAYTDFRSLRGKKIALVDPDSTSGAVMPRYMLKKELNLKLEQYFGQVIYTGSHEKSIMSVMNNDVPAAFVSSSHLSDLVESGSMKTSDIRILWQSGLMPRDPFVYRSGLCEGIRKKISAIFLREDGRHLKALLGNLNAIRFLPVSDSDYDIIRTIAGDE